jgi:hypothetical protein
VSADGGGTGFWTFQYLIYSSTCSGGHGTGTLLNAPGNPNDFACFDSHDVFTQAHPNETFEETLGRGMNDNSIACLTSNANKTFSFIDCAIQSQTASELVLDCGCTMPDAGTCNCGSLSSSNLQNDGNAKCTIDPNAPTPCSVVCCSTGLTDCNGVCSNLSNDGNHCGSCSNVCGPSSSCVGGVCQSVACSTPADCPPTGNECLVPACNANVCGTTPVATGTVTSSQTSGDCRQNQCDGAGNVVSVIDNTDVPADDGNPCTGETCTAGVPAHPALPANTPCGVNGGVCDGAGTCSK